MGTGSASAPGRLSWTLVAWSILAAGCWSPARELDVDGVRVELDERAAEVEWAMAPDLPARLERSLRLAAVYWTGKDDLGALRGWTIRLQSTIVHCAGVIADGCTRPARKVIAVTTLDTSRGTMTNPVACPEALVTAHEVGHVYLPSDAGHHDPRWRAFRPLYEEIFSGAPAGTADVGDRCRRAHLPYVGQWDAAESGGEAATSDDDDEGDDR